MRLSLGLCCRQSLFAGMLVGGLLVVSAALAQDDNTPRVSKEPPTSPNATVNLVNLLVKKGVLTQEQADDLIKQAEDEAYVARRAQRDAAAKAQDADKKAEQASAAVSPPGTKSVRYVPEIVKRDLRNELRKEVMDEAKKENWAAPNTFPEWVSHIRVYGDFRARYEAQFFPPGNDSTGDLLNYNAINTSSTPSNFLPGLPLPVRDVDTDRNRFRLRARLGVEADLLDGFSAGFRIATGDSNTPISTNETLGGGGGNFSKSPIWLDRAWLQYVGVQNALTVSVGRFDNPFFSPDDLIWANELGFDGAAIQIKHEVFPGFTPYVVGGAFALYNTALNYPNNGTLNNNGIAGGNLPSTDKYLFGVQVGAINRLAENAELSWGVAYFDFDKVQGELSSPCDIDTTNFATAVCNTDLLRPSFAQYGNTYMQLRNIVQPPPGDGSNYQYFGLASPFRVLDVTAQLDLSHFNPVHVIFDGTYVKNTAFNAQKLQNIAVNNLGPSPGGNVPGPFAGGDTGAMGRIYVGYPAIHNFGEWSLFAAYKYLESDATLDAFTDPDFGLGGTNLKGYIVGGSFGLGKNVWATTRWLSANSIAGPPFAVDVLQLDLNGRF